MMILNEKKKSKNLKSREFIISCLLPHTKSV